MAVDKSKSPPGELLPEYPIEYTTVKPNRFASLLKGKIMTPQEQAQAGLAAIKRAVLEYVAMYPEGTTNAEITRDLRLQSDFEGAQKNTLSWSIPGLPVNDGLIRYEVRGRSRVYFATGSVHQGADRSVDVVRRELVETLQRAARLQEALSSKA